MFADGSCCRSHLSGGGRGSSRGCSLGFCCVRLNGSGTVCLRAAEAAFVVPVNFAASASDACAVRCTWSSSCCSRSFSSGRKLTKVANNSSTYCKYRCVFNSFSCYDGCACNRTQLAFYTSESPMHEQPCFNTGQGQKRSNMSFVSVSNHHAGTGGQPLYHRSSTIRHDSIQPDCLCQ